MIVERISSKSKLDPSHLEVTLGKATKQGLLDLLDELDSLGKKRVISLGRALRTHDGPNADRPPYAQGFRKRVEGSRLNWTGTWENIAPDAAIVERGRRPRARFPGPRSPQSSVILGWAVDRGIAAAFKKPRRRSTSTGRYIKSGTYTERQLLWLIAKSVKEKGRPAFHIMEFTKNDFFARSQNGRTKVARLISAALRE